MVYSVDKFMTVQVAVVSANTSLPEMVEDVVVLPEVCASIYDYGCSCMVYLRNIKGQPVAGFDAKDLDPTGFQAHAGDIALFKYGDVYHAAFVEENYPEAFKVSEWNYKRGQYTERIIRADDKNLRGFVYRYGK